MVNKQEVLTCFCQVGVTSKEHPTATTGTKFTAHSPSFTIVHAFFSLVFEHLALVNDSPVTIIMFVLLRGLSLPRTHGSHLQALDSETSFRSCPSREDASLARWTMDPKWSEGTTYLPTEVK